MGLMQILCKISTYVLAETVSSSESFDQVNGGIV